MSALDELLAKRPPKQLFHYTSQAGLIGIVADGNLRASKITHLNDSSELSLALEIARSRIEAQKLTEAMRESLSYNLELMESSQINIFVFSLSEEHDQLSQWRGYTPPGAGYSIGFDCAELIKAVGVPVQYALGPCCYDTHTHERIVGEIVSEAIAGRLKLRQPGAGRITAADASDKGFLSEALYFAAPFLKHPKFEEEKEWRLVSNPVSFSDPALHHRPGGSFVVPFLEVKVRKSNSKHPLRTVVIGPTPHPRIARAGVNSLLISAGIPGYETKLSRIPFRQW